MCLSLGRQIDKKLEFFEINKELLSNLNESSFFNHFRNHTCIFRKNRNDGYTSAIDIFVILVVHHL